VPVDDCKLQVAPNHKPGYYSSPLPHRLAASKISSNKNFVTGLPWPLNLITMKSLLHRLIRLDHLINHKSTGKPADCANKIGISESSLYDYLKILKEMGAPVRFSRGRGTYYYAEGGHFHVSFLSKELESEYTELNA
jgi:hypothetical protein